jgi:hypothetical protein
MKMVFQDQVYPTNQTATQASPPHQTSVVTSTEINQQPTIQVYRRLGAPIAVHSATLWSSNGGSRIAESNAEPESGRITCFFKARGVMQTKKWTIRSSDQIK